MGPARSGDGGKPLTAARYPGQMSDPLVKPATWPRLSPHPGSGGALRQTPEDFVVEELPAYAPSGTGEHLYLWVEKRGHTTAHVVAALARALRLPEQKVGVAGLKDRHAVTRQWLSVPARSERDLEHFALDGVRILHTARHGNRLGMGHLHGNRFSVRVRGAPGGAALARQSAALLAGGLPNLFGPQRFGLELKNPEMGLAVLRGESDIKNPRLARFLVSSVQSLLFNELLAERLRRGDWNGVLLGDMAKKHDTGGVFEVLDPGAEAERAAAGLISATGSLHGRKLRPLGGEAGALEAAVLSRFGLSHADFASRKGDRRPLRVFPEGLEVQDEPDSYTLRFSLPKGSFATALLREAVGPVADLPGEGVGEG